MRFSEIYQDVGSYVRQMPGLLLLIFAINTLPLVYADINWTERESVQLGALIGILNLYFQYLVVKQTLLLAERTNSAKRTFVPRIFGGQILYAVTVIIGLMLLVLPGIYIAIRWSLYIQAMIDKDLTIAESFRASWEMTEGRFGSLLVLALPILGLFAIALGFAAIPLEYEYPLFFWTTFESLTTATLMFPWLVFSAIYIHLQKSID